MREFGLRIIDINANPKRKGELKVLGIPVIKGKRLPLWERSTEARHEKERKEAELLVALQQIEKDGDQRVSTIKVLAEKGRQDFETSVMPEKIIRIFGRRRDLEKRFRKLIKETGSSQNARLVLLMENGISPELLEMPVPPTLLKESLGGRGGGKETEKPGSYRKSLPPFLEKRDKGRK